MVTCSVLLSTGERGKGEHWFREQKTLSLCHLEDWVGAREEPGLEKARKRESDLM